MFLSLFCFLFGYLFGDGYVVRVLGSRDRFLDFYGCFWFDYFSCRSCILEVT